MAPLVQEVFLEGMVEIFEVMVLEEIEVEVDLMGEGFIVNCVENLDISLTNGTIGLTKIFRDNLLVEVEVIFNLRLYWLIMRLMEFS